MQVTLKDVNDEEYDSILFKKAFFIEYKEEFDIDTGVIAFYAFIREFKQEELVIKPITPVKLLAGDYFSLADETVPMGALALADNKEFASVETDKCYFYSDDVLIQTGKVSGGKYEYDAKNIWSYKELLQKGYRYGSYKENAYTYKKYTCTISVKIDGKAAGTSSGYLVKGEGYSLEPKKLLEHLGFGLIDKTTSYSITHKDLSKALTLSKATYLNGDEADPGSLITLDNVQIRDLLNVINNNTGMSTSASLAGKVVTVELTTMGSGNIDQDLYANNTWYKTHADYISQIGSLKSNAAVNNLLSTIKQAYTNNLSIYQNISSQTGLPPELIAAIHYRESATDFLNGTFDIYLHNGEPLGTTTTIVPIGKYYKEGKFVDAATDALKGELDTQIQKYYLETRKIQLKLTSSSKDITAMVVFAVFFNGTGGSLKGLTSYGYNGTDIFKGGLYTSDGNYNPNAADQNLGIYQVLKELL